mmetsp:Transcript_34186/g.37789  ORF Transcript_34186/g.37789 Transcript_34186/m.37789 type:complete len:226 (+) Transcript_34186:378-1055(+)
MPFRISGTAQWPSQCRHGFRPPASRGSIGFHTIPRPMTRTRFGRSPSCRRASPPPAVGTREGRWSCVCRSTRCANTGWWHGFRKPPTAGRCHESAKPSPAWTPTSVGCRERLPQRHPPWQIRTASRPRRPRWPRSRILRSGRGGNSLPKQFHWPRRNQETNPFGGTGERIRRLQTGWQNHECRARPRQSAHVPRMDPILPRRRQHRRGSHNDSGDRCNSHCQNLR